MVFLAATLTLAFVAFAVRFYYATRASKKRRFVTDDTFEFQERSITFTTCKDLYRKLKREPPPFAFLPHLFQNCPEEGIEVQVEYIDTSPEDKTKPLLVALHGVPGSYMDFAKFAQYFTSSYRVVAPNFPDFSLTCAQEAFWHSNIERTQFVLDFLAALNISDIDCLVCHSAANTIASSLWSEPTSLSIKSLVLITPPSPKWLNRYQLPYAQRLVRVGSSKMQRNLFKTLWPDFMSKYVGVPTTITENTDKDGMLWMTFAAVLSNFECLHERLEILKQKQIPTVFIFGDRDGLLPRNKFGMILDILGVEEKNFTIYDENDQLQQEGNFEDWIKVLNFKSGGHFCYLKYDGVFHRFVADFLNHVIGKGLGMSKI